MSIPRAIAFVQGRKTYVYVYEYATQSWNNFSRSNGHCQIKVIERGRKDFFIHIVDERDANNEREYSLLGKAQVTKTDSLLQIPVTNAGRACLLGVKFHDHDEECQFLLTVAEKIPGFGLPLLGPGAPPHNPVPNRPHNNQPAPVAGYVKPTMPPPQAQPSTKQSYQPPTVAGGSKNMTVDFSPTAQNLLPAAGPKTGFVHVVQDQPHYEEVGGHLPQVRKAWEEPMGGGKQHNPPVPRDTARPGGFPEERRRDQMDYGQRNQPDYQREYDPRYEAPFGNRQGYVPQQQQKGPPTLRQGPDSYRVPQNSLQSTTQKTMNDPEFVEEMNDYAQQLASAISCGMVDDATKLAKLVTDLVLQQKRDSQASLGMFSLKFEPDKEAEPPEEKFTLILQVEEFSGTRYPLYEDVKPSDTIDQLKSRFQKKFRLFKECQTWIFGDKLADDKQSLRELGITEEGHTVYIYMQRQKKMKASKASTDRLKEHMGGAKGSSPDGSPSMSSLRPGRTAGGGGVGGGGYSLEPPEFMQTKVDTIRTKKPAQDIPFLHPAPVAFPQHQTRQDPVALQFPPSNQHNDAFYRGPSGPSQFQGVPLRTPPGGIRVMPSEIPNNPPQIGPISPLAPPAPPPPKVGWECSSCTYCNLPFRPGCEMCDGPRPEGYEPPPDYIMTEAEKKFVNEDKQQDAMLQEMFKKEQDQKKRQAEENFQNLIQTDDQALVTNTEIFECPICFLEIEPGDGVILRSCLHQFCKNCLHDSTVNSEHVQVQCPYDNGDYQCQEIVSDRELRAVLSPEELEALYNRGLRQVEAAAVDSFHCKTTDCPGFCFYEDEVNEYKCNICLKLNCILCKAQHEGKNCQEYQEDLKVKAANDEAAQQTQAMLEKLIADGEAMNCPQCKVIVTKKIGCDWIRCSVCRTEMCWATKGPRWGPKGRGDISGGCRCGVNRKKCHDNCRNCH